MIDILFALIANSHGWNAAALALVAFAVRVLAAQGVWRQSTAPESPLAVRLTEWTARPGAQVAVQLLRLFYYIGLPFVALYLGWVDLRSVGLGQLNWPEGVRWAIVLLLAAWLLLMLIWLPYLRATLARPAPPDAQSSLARRLVEIIYMQAHWAFYRAAAIALFTGVIRDAFYWGSALGLGLVCLEAFADPQVRARLTRVGAADGLVWNAGQAVLNALAFIVTRNLYLLLLIQLVLEVTVPHRRPTRTADPLRAGEPTRALR